MKKPRNKSGQRRHGAPTPLPSPICHSSLAGRAVLHPLPADHPAAVMLPPVVELAAVIAHTMRADPAVGPDSLRQAAQAELPTIHALLAAERDFRAVLACPECHGTGRAALATAPVLTAFAGTVRDLGILLSTRAAAEALVRDYAVSELLAGRAHVTPEGAIVAKATTGDAAERRPALSPSPVNSDASGMLAVVVHLAAIVAFGLAKPPAPGWLPMRAAMRHDFPLVQAVLLAQRGFSDLLARPDRRPGAVPIPDMAPAVAAFSHALATIAATMMQGAAVAAVRRDYAVRELLAGRAWAAPDGSIIGDPAHAA